MDEHANTSQPWWLHSSVHPVWKGASSLVAPAVELWGASFLIDSATLWQYVRVATAAGAFLGFLYGHSADRRGLRGDGRVRAATRTLVCCGVSFLIFFAMLTSLRMDLPYEAFRWLGTFLATAYPFSNAAFALVWAVTVGTFTGALVLLSPFLPSK